MDTQDIITIISQLSNHESSLDILPWQREIIGRAQLLSAEGISSIGDIDVLQYAKALSTVGPKADWNKAEYFCFLPTFGKKWKVFVLDKFRNVLTELESFDEEVKTGEVVRRDAFVCRICG